MTRTYHYRAYGGVSPICGADSKYALFSGYFLGLCKSFGVGTVFDSGNESSTICEDCRDLVALELLAEVGE